MKISEAKAAYSSQMQTLWAQKRALTEALKEQEKSGIPSFDRVELSKELKKVDAEYKKAQSVVEGIMATEAAVHNSEVSRQQIEAMEKSAKKMAKMMEIYRRIASGGRVPPEDENALMLYSKELYMAAKMAAMIKKDKDNKKYDTLLDEEDSEGGENTDAAEVAANTEISVAAPDAAGDAGAAIGL